MEKKLQKNISCIYQTSWQAHYQILSIILLKEFIKIKCKCRHIIKKCETCGITYEVWDCFLEYTNFTDYLTQYKCSCCNQNYEQSFDKKLNE